MGGGIIEMGGGYNASLIIMSSGSDVSCLLLTIIVTTRFMRFARIK